MDSRLEFYLERLIFKSAGRREDLLKSALRKSRTRRRLNMVAGVLALTSAASIVAVLTQILGGTAMQILAALVAAISGTISLAVDAYYSEDQIGGRLAGASKYLALRDAVFRVAINSDTTDQQKLKMLSDLQTEYSALDAAYSKYFTLEGSELQFSSASLEKTAPPEASADLAELRNRIEAQTQKDGTV
jgi:hypothetical protein